jgi:hypothetical protein
VEGRTSARKLSKMNVNNFIARPKRKLLGKYDDAEAWEKLEVEDRKELVGDVLPAVVVELRKGKHQFAVYFGLLIP